MVMKYILLFLKVLLSIFFLLFAITAFLTGAYMQGISLLLLMGSFFYWPFFITKPWLSATSRTLWIVLILILQITAFKPDARESIYTSEQLRKELYHTYEEKLSSWPEGTERIYLDTEYGKVHVLAYGDERLPPILLFHAASMGAHSWSENIPPLLGSYRIYAIDNIGEGNLSELNQVTDFPIDAQEVAKHYAGIAEQLGVRRSPVLGASHGGFIAQAYAHHYPEKVESLVLFAPLGLTKLSGKSIFMLSVASLYPLNFVRDRVTRWLFGTDTYCYEQYGDWFQLVLKSSLPSVAMPQPLEMSERTEIEVPILLFLGEADPVVGTVDRASQLAEQYPRIEIDILESGHLIAVEEREIVNRRLAEFLKSTSEDDYPEDFSNPKKLDRR